MEQGQQWLWEQPAPAAKAMQRWVGLLVGHPSASTVWCGEVTLSEAQGPHLRAGYNTPQLGMGYYEEYMEASV